MGEDGLTLRSPFWYIFAGGVTLEVLMVGGGESLSHRAQQVLQKLWWCSEQLTSEQHTPSLVLTLRATREFVLLSAKREADGRHPNNRDIKVCA